MEKHHVKLAHLAQAIAIWALEAQLFDFGIHLRESQLGHVFKACFFKQMIGTVAFIGLEVLYQWVGKTSAGVAAGLPDSRIHKDGSIEAVHIVALGNEVFPPQSFDVVLEQDTIGAVVVGAGEAAVDFGALKNKTTPFGERDKCYRGM